MIVEQGRVTSHHVIHSRAATRHIASALLGACWVLFTISAVVAGLISYDLPAAYGRLLPLLAGLALCIVAAWAGRTFHRERYTLAASGALGLFCAAATVAIAGFVLGGRPANAGPHAGALATLLPLSLALLPWARTLGGYRRRAAQAVVLAAALAGVAALWQSGERSALAALLLAMLGAVLWVPFRHTNSTLRRAAWAVLATAAVAGGLVVLNFLAGPMGDTLQPIWMPAWLWGRMQIWHDALPLIMDYRFTGSGLATTPLVFASYSMLTHVPYLDNVHNLYLHTALEQGLLGALGLIGLLAASMEAVTSAHLHRPELDRDTRWAVLTSLLATTLLGLVDSEIGASSMAGLLLLPVAMAQLVRYAPANRVRSAHAGLRGAVAAPLAAVAIIAMPLSRSALDANLGALAQTRTELTGYASARWALQDAIRRERVLQLEPIVNRLERVAATEPLNATAQRRLGQIRLSLGENADAREHLEQAASIAPDERVARQLLGELDALDGNAESAAAQWATLRLEQRQLETRLAWYSETGSTLDVRRMTDAIQLTTLRMQEQKTAGRGETK